MSCSACSCSVDQGQARKPSTDINITVNLKSGHETSTQHNLWLGVPADGERGRANRVGVWLVWLKWRCQMAGRGGLGYAKTTERRTKTFVRRGAGMKRKRRRRIWRNIWRRTGREERRRLFRWRSLRGGPTPHRPSVWHQPWRAEEWRIEGTEDAKPWEHWRVTSDSPWPYVHQYKKMPRRPLHAKCFFCVCANYPLPRLLRWVTSICESASTS